MITSVKIVDNNNTPLGYISDLENFSNGTEYNFKSGINVIIGKNGCGKTTLLKLISQYTLCNNQNFSKIPTNTLELCDLYKHDFGDEATELRDGVEVKCDYRGVIYNYITHKDMTKENIFDNSMNFSNYYNNLSSSTGETMLNSFDNLMKLAFSNTRIEFPIQDIFDLKRKSNDFWNERLDKLIGYYKKNVIDITQEEFEYTFLLDEPDRNLDITNIEMIYQILSHKKKYTQLICVIHNPILIYKLSKLNYINFIEMTDGYLEEIKEVFNNL